MTRQLFITIPTEKMFKNDKCIVPCKVDGITTPATVDIRSKGRALTIPATPNVNGLGVTRPGSQHVVAPTVFNITVGDYVPIIYTGHFGDKAQLRLMNKIIVPELFASNVVVKA